MKQDKNNAIQKFEAEHLLEFDKWYSNEILTHIANLSSQSDKLKYIFFDKGIKEFKSQLEALNMLHNNLKQPRYFICKEPGAGQNHYIFGLLVKDNLIFINPVGHTNHKDFYQWINDIKKECNLNIYLSNTNIQQDIYLGSKGLFSCGPICAELIRGISEYPVERILKFIDQFKTQQTLIEHELEYREISVEELLPNSLRNVLNSAALNIEQYKEKILKLDSSI